MKSSPSKKSWINWGTGILITIIIFMTITILTGIYLMNQDVQLVTENYYEKDLKYQQQIDKMNRTAALDEKTEIKFDGSIVEIIFPESFKYQNISGEVYFYRPSDKKKDFILPLSLSSELKQIIPVTRIDKGFWRIKLSWSSDGSEYYNERAITIN
jgi:hypothetical protein